MSASELKKLLNKQDDIQALIEIIRYRYSNDLEFEKKLYKLRLTYIRQINIIFNIQLIENELLMIIKD